MPKLSFDRQVPFSPQQMLALVGDLKSYPAFVPNCSHMEVMQDSGQTGDVRLARMAVRFGPIKQAYTSRVTVDADDNTIDAKAVDGPFSHLDSTWRFTPEGDHTRVQFDIDFGISNLLIAAVAEPAFAAKQDEILEAFLAEAERRYG